MSAEWIRLLSEKPMCDYSPEDYKLMVRSLYYKPEPKRKALPFSWRLTPKGRLTLRISRRPKVLLRKEIEQIAKESGRTEAEVLGVAERLKITLV